MAEIEGCFCRQFDQSMMDTHNPVGRYQALLALLDPQLFISLVRKGMDPRFYVLRWLSLLFSQEMELPDVLRLWDSLFGDPNRFEFLLFFAVAMIRTVRDQLLAEDFAPCLMLLQNLQVPDVCSVISDATELLRVTDPVNLEPANLAKIYESAMNEALHPGSQTQQHAHNGALEKAHRLKERLGFTRKRDNSASKKQAP